MLRLDQSSGGTQLRTAARSRCSRHRRRPGLGWIIYHYHTCCWSHWINMTPEYLLVSKSLKVFLALDHKLHIPNMPPGRRPPYPHTSIHCYIIHHYHVHALSAARKDYGRANLDMKLNYQIYTNYKMENIHFQIYPFGQIPLQTFHVQRASEGL